MSTTVSCLRKPYLITLKAKSEESRRRHKYREKKEGDNKEMNERRIPSGDDDLIRERRRRTTRCKEYFDVICLGVHVYVESHGVLHGNE